MGKHTQWITHQGTRILHVNLRGLSENDIMAALEEMRQELMKDKSGPPVLFDQAGAAQTPATAKKTREVVAACDAAGCPTSPAAIVGLTKLQKVFVQVIGHGTHFCDTVDEAKEWLVKQGCQPR